MPKNKINSYMEDLKRFIDDQKPIKDRNLELRKKIVSLGAYVKKENLNFKEIKKIKEEQKEKKKEKKFKMEQAGVKEKRRRRK